MLLTLITHLKGLWPLVNELRKKQASLDYSRLSNAKNLNNHFVNIAKNLLDKKSLFFGTANSSSFSTISKLFSNFFR